MQRIQHTFCDTRRTSIGCQSTGHSQKRKSCTAMQIDKGFTDNWLQPTGAQERLMRQYAGCKRFVWNRALSMEQARYRRGEKKQLGRYAMMKQLTRRNNPDPHSNFLKDAPVHALQCVLFELYDSYQRFFKASRFTRRSSKRSRKAKLVSPNQIQRSLHWTKPINKCVCPSWVGSSAASPSASQVSPTA